MSNFKISKTILENINEQNDRINKCVDTVNGIANEQELNQEMSLNEQIRQQNELIRQEQYNNNENKFTKVNDKISYITYEEFGAIGDGVVDDGDAIKRAHEYANTVKLPIKCESNKTYYIKNIDKYVLNGEILTLNRSVNRFHGGDVAKLKKIALKLLESGEEESEQEESN